MSTSCEECGSTKLEFEKGWPGSWDEPASDDCWTCLECGAEMFEDAWDRLEAQADDEFDRRREEGRR